MYQEDFYENHHFPNEISELCYKHFERLPKKGKPQISKEWTTLAAIVKSSKNFQKLKIVSLSTGTKCLGLSHLSEKGDVLFDSHAEVLARRAFIKYLYHHSALVMQKKESDILFLNEIDAKLHLKPDVEFHLFVSNIPCGDAAIFPNSLNDECEQLTEEKGAEDSLESKPKKLKRDETNHITFPANLMVVNDIHRTGAKCVEDGLQDPKESGTGYHVTGTLRTKPGRGDPTWSMSCSDKIAMWNVCGMQGALLSMILKEPVYLSSIIFGKCPFSEKAAKRAFIERLSSLIDLDLPCKLNQPRIYQSCFQFKFGKESATENSVACPASIIWCDIPGFLEVSVDGRKQGVTKKNLHKPSSRISVCKSLLLENFLEVASLLSDGQSIKSKNLTYLEYKQLATSYQQAKESVFKIFHGWKRKPINLQKFTCLFKAK